MMYDVNKSIHVIVYLLPEEVGGNLPMESIAMHAKGTFGISKYSWGWNAVFGKFLNKLCNY